MASRFHSRGPVRSRARRETSWFPIDAAQTSIASDTAIIISSLTAGEGAKRPFTIIRTQLTVHLSTDQLIANEIQALAVGMCVVSDQASAIGVTAVPTPDTDAGSDLWFLHRYIVNDFVFNSAIGFDARGGIMLHIDSKAMCKVNDDEDVVLVAESASFSFGSTLFTGGRLLIKEH